MYQRLPFYMVYDIDNNIFRRDYNYMKSTYPDIAKRVMPYVEKECDRIEYSGSMMFDEYPDQLQLRMLCRKILKSIQKGEDDLEEGKWLEDLVHVLTWNEILRRRMEYREYKRKFY